MISGQSGLSAGLKQGLFRHICSGFCGSHQGIVSSANAALDSINNKPAMVILLKHKCFMVFSLVPG